MRRGLVIGKFMPIHRGHIALINFAAQQCDELIVSMSYTDHDPIPGELRFSWISEIFKERQRIKPAIVRDDFDDETLPLVHRTKVWSDFLHKTYPKVDILFSSEEYGEPLADHLGALHQSFDPERNQIPVSATRIRTNPYQFWDFIPGVVRPYYVKKVCFYGPESTGKTTLAIKMAERYQTDFVPEVARELITSNDFTVEDIVRIGYAQRQRVEDKSRTANKVLFCDTDAITTQVYSRHYLNVVPAELLAVERAIKYDRYFLMDVDVLWVADGLRDLGEHREKMFHVFKDELVRRNIPYTLIRGNYEEREAVAAFEVDKMLRGSHP